MTSDKHTFDFIVVGGGQAACVVASRLSQLLPDVSVAMLEAGSDAHDNPLVQSPLGCTRLHNTDLEWNYKTTPQQHLDGREIYHCGGKVVSGSSAVNYGMWCRCHSADFDTWAQHIKDERWSYENMLPYFRKIETHYLPREDTPNPHEHGFDGPIKTVPGREWPMTNCIKDAFSETGISLQADANSGQPIGLAKTVSTWHNDARQAAGTAYDLSKVHVMTNTLVEKIVVQEENGAQIAREVILHDGRRLTARNEIIVSCGTFKTPQLLMLSGIGDRQKLQAAGVTAQVDLPEVGQNLHDHPSIVLYWKVKDPEKGLAIGSKAFGMPKTGPSDFVYTGTVPKDDLVRALHTDKYNSPSEHPNVSSERAHYEIVTAYGPVGVPPGMEVPMDGSIISTGAICFLPTSRGSVTLKSLDPQADPIIDPNFLATEHDWAILRSAMRTSMRVMDTDAAKELVEGQFQFPGYSIDINSTDEALNKRIMPFSSTWYHPAGTAAMGSVVDSECRVKGVKALRVVDASVLPHPLAAHYQAAIYAIAEHAADMIAASHRS